jgi:hypothetical protein
MLAMPSPAHACGIWFLTDHGAKREGVFEINAVRVAPYPADPKDPRGHGLRPAMTIALVNNPEGPATCSFGGQNISIRPEGAFAGRRKLATIDGEHWTIGGKAYEVSITAKEHADAPWKWHVSIEQKGVLVAEGDAMSFACMGPSTGEERDRQNVSQHLMCYMLARAQGFKRFSPGK